MPDTAFKPANLDNKTVQRILAAAMTCWSRAGYHGASLKDVAQEAGVAKSLLHYHFASKEHLLIELQTVYSRNVAGAIRARLATATPSIEAGLAAMDQVFEAILATREQFPFALEVWRASLGNAAVRERMLAFERELHALFLEGVHTTLGPVADRLVIPPDRLAALLQVALGGFELRLFLDPDPARLRRTYEDFKHLLRLALLSPEGGR